MQGEGTLLVATKVDAHESMCETEGNTNEGKGEDWDNARHVQYLKVVAT